MKRDYHRLWWFDARDARRRRVRHYISTVDLDESKLTHNGDRCGATFIARSRTGSGEVWIDASESPKDFGELVVHEWCHAALRGFGGMPDGIAEEAIVEHMAPHLWALMRSAGMLLPPLPDKTRSLSIHAKAVDRAHKGDE